jgi:hypothetical protein
MGNFSGDTFDRLKQYVSVRLQQGVPLLDSDWNEMDDIRRFELQSFLKWFVEDGIPKGNDGFRIKAIQREQNPSEENPSEENNLTTSSGQKTPKTSVRKIPKENNFIIQGGDGTANGAGRCLVQGWEVLIPNDIDYLKQNEGKVKEEDKVLELTTPTEADRIDKVYLDMWEEEVPGNELVRKDLGIETCVRIQRKWLVRVIEGTGNTNQTIPPGHIYYELAELTRKKGEPIITSDDIKDLRNVDVSITSSERLNQFEQTLKQHDKTLVSLQKDLRNVNVSITSSERLNQLEQTLNQHDKTLESLREFINIMLRKDVVASMLHKDVVASQMHKLSEDSISYRGTAFALEARDGIIWVFWQGNDGHISYRRTNTIGEWKKQEQLAVSNKIRIGDSCALEANDGSVWVFWCEESSEKYDIFCRKTEHDVAKKLGNPKKLFKNLPDFCRPCALEVDDGSIWVFWCAKEGDQYGIFCSNVEVGHEGKPTKLSDIDNLTSYPYAFQAKDGTIWVFWHEGNSSGIFYIRAKLSSTSQAGPIDERKLKLPTKLTKSRYPYALEDKDGTVWVFWNEFGGASDCDIYYTKIGKNTTGGLMIEEKLSDKAGTMTRPRALETKDGNICVFWNQKKDNKHSVYYRKCDRRAVETWMPEQKLPERGDSNASYFLSAVKTNNGIILLSSQSSRIWYQKVFIEI